MDTNDLPTEEELKEKLTPEEYRVLRESDTEAPFSGAYVDNHDKGVYRCKVCNNVLFSSNQKFDSGMMEINSLAKPGSPVVPVALKIGVDKLDPGLYKAEFIVADSNGRQVTRSIGFEVL